MIGMIILSFVIGYPIFMFFAFYIAKMIFTPLDKIAQEQKRERELLLQRARRVPKLQRVAQVAHA